MNRRDCLKAVGTAPLALASAKGMADASRVDSRQRLVIDGQAGLYDPYSVEPYGANDPYAKISRRAVRELRDSGLTATSFTVNAVGNDDDVWSKTIKTIAEDDLWVLSNSDILTKVKSSSDILLAGQERKIGVIYNTQDTSLLGSDLDRLTLLKGLGVRVVQLTYNVRNLSGDGCLEPANAGLSRLGRDVIARIEKEKLLLDLSHAGVRTASEAISAATRPMTISHTGCRSLDDNPRNMWDSELKACAEKGGVVGIYWTAFLTSTCHATSADLLRHMNHAREVCGEDHVSVGTDSVLFKTRIDDQARAHQKRVFEQRLASGIDAPCEGPDVFNIVWDWDSHRRFDLLAEGLEGAGWTGRQIDKVLGGNLMRLYEETWG